MARLLPFVGIPVIKNEPLAGPETVGAGQNTSIGGFTQDYASPLGGWVYRFTFRPLTGDEYVHFRGWIAAQHRGANATRWQLTQRDKVSSELAGVSYNQGGGIGWSNGQNWSNGAPWALTFPNVRLAAPVPFDTTVVTLEDEFWGHKLGWGRELGFFPLYFGMHVITEVIEPGKYRVWPPLRKEFAAGDFATLYPVMAMRMIGQDFVMPAEESRHSFDAKVTMMEVMDYDVRDYFAD